LLGGVGVLLLVVSVIVVLEETLWVCALMLLVIALIALLWSDIQTLYLTINEDSQRLEIHFRHALLARTVRFAQVKALRLESPNRAALGYGLRYDLRGGQWFINSDAKQFICFDLERGYKLYVQCGDALELDGLVSKLERMIGLS
jgi:hypothetical protein